MRPSQCGIWDFISKPSPPLEDVNRTASGKIYEELGQNQIRVVKLHAAPADMYDIICSLQTIKLETGVTKDYEALSYVWGTTDNPATITLNGQPYNITRNLEAALRRLRNAKKARYLWVDALAINQSSISERGRQVRLMPNVYASGKQTIIWLGPQSKNALATLVFMKLFNTNKDGEKPSFLEHVNSDAIITNAYRFMTMPYWKRAWVFQEAVRSKSVEIQAGEFSAPFEGLLKFWSVLKIIMDEQQGELSNTQSMAFRVAKAQLSAMPIDLIRPRGLAEVPLFNFKRWLEDFALQRNCQDPRDKVFAAYSLFSEDIRRRISLSYELSTQQVFTDITRAFVQIEGPFAIMEEIDHIGSASEFVDDSPSWVPAYIGSDGTRGPSVRRSLFSGLSEDPKVEALQTRARATGEFYLGDGQRVLQVSGYLIGTCSRVSSSFQKAKMIKDVAWQDYTLEELGRVLRHCKTCAQDLGVEAEQMASFTYTFLGPRVLSLETAVDWLRLIEIVSEHDVPMAEIFTGMLKGSAADADGFIGTPEWFLNSFQAMTATHAGRSMFSFAPSVPFASDDPVPEAEQEANVGIGVDKTQPGDEIYVIPGSLDPFILRSCHNGHRIVGNAFIGRLRDPTWLWDKIEEKDLKLDMLSIV